MPLLSRIGSAAARGFGLFVGKVLDPYFKYVTLLLHGDGTNGAQNNTFLDSSTNNFTITRNGNTTQGTFSPYGSNWGTYFNGSSSLSISSSNTALPTGTQDFCVEMWVNWATQSGSYPQLIANPATSGFQIYYDVGAAALSVGIFNIANVITYTISQATLNGVWNHIAVTRSGNTFRLFVNGVLQANGTNVINYAAVTTQYIGSDGSRPYTGYMSNVRTVLGSIPTAYQTSSTTNGTSVFTPSTTPLTAVSGTALLTCQSNRFLDNSSNAFALTVNGSPTIQRFSPFSPAAEYNTSVISGSGYFDGTGDYLNTTNGVTNVGTGDVCVECWVYYTGTFADYGFIFDSRSGSPFTNGFAIAIEATTGYFLVSQDVANLQTTIVCRKSTWHHVCVTRQSGVFRMFINGVLGGTYTSSSNLSSTSNRIGWYYGATTSYQWPGFIADLRATKSAVPTTYQTSSTTVGAVIFTPPTAPLTTTSQGASGTSLLLNYTNAGIYDNAMMNDLETVGNAQVSTSVVKFGTGSMSFNGTNSYLNEPSSQNFAIGNVFTVEFWLYLNAAPTSANAMYATDFRGGSTNNYTFGVIDISGNTRLYAFCGSGGGEVRGSTNITTGTWYHLAYVNTGSTLTGYLNGVSQGTLAVSFSQAATNVIIGARYTGATEYLNGYIDDLRITKGYARYTTTFTPPTAAFPNQ